MIKGKKRMLCGLMAVCCLLGLTACHKAEEPAPTVEPAPTAASGQNPLQNAVIDYLNQRDNSVAKANEIMEAYQPAEGETATSTAFFIPPSTMRCSRLTLRRMMGLWICCNLW